MLFLVEALFNFYSQRQTDQWGEKPSWKGFGLTFGLTGTIQRGDGFLASLRYIINVLVIVPGKRKFDFNSGPESCFFLVNDSVVFPGPDIL